MSEKLMNMYHHNMPVCSQLLVSAAGGISFAIVAGGCSLPAPEASLRSPLGAARAAAITQSVTTDDAAAIPGLIVLLSADDPADRLFAIEALQRITGRDFGYEAIGPRPQRLAAIERWKQAYPFAAVGGDESSGLSQPSNGVSE